MDLLAGTTQKALKAKVDALYAEKREKEFDMENLRNISRKLMDDDRVCDQFVMKEGLSEVEAKWHELTELLVQQVSLEVNTRYLFMSVLIYFSWIVTRAHRLFQFTFKSIFWNHQVLCNMDYVS